MGMELDEDMAAGQIQGTVPVSTSGVTPHDKRFLERASSIFTLSHQPHAPSQVSTPQQPGTTGKWCHKTALTERITWGM